jgi:hypothetical protein
MKKFLNFLTILGFLLLLASVIIRQYETSQGEKYESVTGTITEINVTSFNGSAEIYYFCPKLEFTTAYEQQLAFYPPCATGLNDYKKGQQFEIRFDPMYPGDAHLNGVEVRREWFEPRYSTFLAGLGMFIILAGLVQAWWTKRKE